MYGTITLGVLWLDPDNSNSWPFMNTKFAVVEAC